MEEKDGPEEGGPDVVQPMLVGWVCWGSVVHERWLSNRARWETTVHLDIQKIKRGIKIPEVICCIAQPVDGLDYRTAYKPLEIIMVQP